MAHYQTEQKKILLSYLKKHSDQAFTVEQLCEQMKQELDQNLIPGKSTVYRVMPRLVEEGQVKRFVRGNSRQFLYQMICGDHCSRHLHMKCSVCGKLYHMEDEESEELLLQVMRKHRFQVDEGKTILFGQCESCGQEG
ncbi:MAG: transcriptional repressor [Lachnospiraceae bacterium]|nr:transcriptional repressor [Lachnospiraceae bacterium]